jgi:hypothetical protein
VLTRKQIFLHSTKSEIKPEKGHERQTEGGMYRGTNERLRHRAGKRQRRGNTELERGQAEDIKERDRGDRKNMTE